jgi:hypothetical protein
MHAVSDYSMLQLPFKLISVPLRWESALVLVLVLAFFGCCTEHLAAVVLCSLLSAKMFPRPHSNVSFLDPADSRKMVSPSYDSKKKIMQLYDVVGFISSGTYGRVYKAKSKSRGGVYAIKKYDLTTSSE